MKKLSVFIAIVFISASIMVSCDDGKSSPIWIELDASSPTKANATVYGGSKVVYDINVGAESPVTSFEISSIDTKEGRVQRVSESPGTKTYSYEYTHDIPKFENEPEEVRIQIIAVNSNGDKFTKTCTLKVINTNPDETEKPEEGGE